MVAIKKTEWTDVGPYTGHKLGRQLGAGTLNSGLFALRALGDYRVNLSLYATNPKDPRFSGGLGIFYRSDTPLGKASQTIFLPSSYRNHELSPGEVENLHRSGLRLRTAAGWGLFASLVTRVGANILYSAKDSQKEHLNHENPVAPPAIWLDSASIAATMVSTVAFNVGQHLASSNSQTTVCRLLRGSWRANILGSGLQMGAGILRMGVEFSNYLETGKMNNSTVLYSSLDTFGGASGIAWSHYVLSEAKMVAQSGKAINGVTEESHALLGVLEPPMRIKWGMRAINSIGSIAGLAFNVYDFVDALNDPMLSEEKRHKRMVSSELGMTSSLLMGAASLLIGTALAPIAGVAMATGFGVLIGQTVFDYFA